MVGKSQHQTPEPKKPGNDAATFWVTLFILSALWIGIFVAGSPGFPVEIFVGGFLGVFAVSVLVMMVLGEATNPLESIIALLVYFWPITLGLIGIAIYSLFEK